MYGLHTASAYTAAGPCLYGTFSGSQTAVGTINDNLSLFRCVLVRFTVGMVSSLSISISLTLSIDLVTMRKKDAERHSKTKREREREREALLLNQDRRARGLALVEEANTSAVAAAFLSMKGASENVSKPQSTEPDERGDLYRFGSWSRRTESRSRRAMRSAGGKEGWPV